ncbi:MAG: hypothetical protein NTU65_07290 [Cyanobacteria bacterium]|nr:hypothetical protein [Cyanobacteriota bacterium]
MVNTLFFVLAPAPGLPQGKVNWADLADAQARGLDQLLALRIFACPPDWPGSLETLVEAGLAHSGGADPYGASAMGQPQGQPRERRLRCDATVPLLDATSLCLGIYGQAEGSPEEIQCLACLPFAAIENETCWFYPTENGRYLSWQSQRSRTFLPGRLPVGEPAQAVEGFDPADLRLLWSLLADDPAMTCVGLTYRGRRIEWPLQALTVETQEAASVWTWFELDDLSSEPWQRLDRIETSPRC